MAAFKFYLTDTSFIEGERLPDSVSEALNALHMAHVDGINSSVHFEADGTTSISYDVRMDDLRKNFLPSGVEEAMNALRVLFSLESPGWTKYRATDKIQGTGNYRMRAIQCHGQKVVIYIALHY